MHLNFDFSARQILWTLTFAAQLVLLVVLLGRNRAQRFPWFTTGIVLFALRLMAEVLLSGRIAMVNLQEILLVMNDLVAIVGLLVLVEVARRGFAGAGHLTWINGSMALVVASGLLLLLWGPWPAWRSLAPDTLLGRLRLMQWAAQKVDAFGYLVAVGLGVLVVVFGSRFKAGWRSHAQMIVIGLSAVGIVWLTLQKVWQNISQTMHPHTQQEYQHVISLGSTLMRVNDITYLAALLWWIAWLWLDEPGAAGQIPASVSDNDAPAGAAMDKED
jgi:hypothetical protein